MNGESPTMQQIRYFTQVDNKETPAISTETWREKEMQSNASKHYAQIRVCAQIELTTEDHYPLNTELLLLREGDPSLRSTWRCEASRKLIK